MPTVHDKTKCEAVMNGTQSEPQIKLEALEAHNEVTEAAARRRRSPRQPSSPVLAQQPSKLGPPSRRRKLALPEMSPALKRCRAPAAFPAPPALPVSQKKMMSSVQVLGREVFYSQLGQHILFSKISVVEMARRELPIVSRVTGEQLLQAQHQLTQEEQLLQAPQTLLTEEEALTREEALTPEEQPLTTEEQPLSQEEQLLQAQQKQLTQAEQVDKEPMDCEEKANVDGLVSWEVLQALLNGFLLELALTDLLCNYRYPAF